MSYINNYEDNVDYMLPEEFFSYAPDIGNLTSLFSYTIQPHNGVLLNCFKPLRQALTVNMAFYRCYWNGNSSERTNISEVFRTNQIRSLTDVFAMSSDSTDGYPKSQYISFNNIFASSYASPRYASDSNFSRAFYGYSNNGNVVHEVNKTLPDNTETKNYSFII